MRFVWAVAAFVLATVLIVAGIAQRTVFQGPTIETAEISVAEDAPFVLIDGAVFNALPGSQTLRANAEGEIFAAYGRTADMQAWLADTTYNSVTLDAAGEIDVALVEPAPPATEDEQASTTGTEAPATPEATEAAVAPDTTEQESAEGIVVAGRSPAGSDLWLDEFQQSDLLIASLQLPEEMSVLVAADGTLPAPTAVSVSWPIGNGTPLAGPLIAMGAILMTVGVFLYILGINHVRRSRGPRRKGLPIPVTEPIDVGSIEGEEKGVITSTPTRRSISGSRRAFAVVPGVAVAALLFSGCAADAWPQLSAESTPTPTATVVAPEGQKPPAVTSAQAERILAEISTTVAEADESMDADLAATRLSGPALAVRETNYVLRDALEDTATPDPILDQPLEILLPQAYDGWPRSVMAVVDDEASKLATIVVMSQADPWAEYKISHVARLEASTLMPDLAPAYIGAAQVQPDSPFLVIAPEDLATAYSDVINNAEESEYYDLFDAETDALRVSIATDREERLAAFNETGATTGELTFSTTAGTDEPIALATLESGAIVAVTITEHDSVKPTNEDAFIKLSGNPMVEELTGEDQSATGFSTDYSDQVFFYVPGQGSTEKIRLLGYGSDILGAKVIN
ncbi:glycosyl transferase [Microbacterium sp. NPDC076911]|uniref:glycosyl transferase n=1 Tax=Microbacterium sp. NPDC076911 TaxID=3154958 RepID=UPI00343DBCFA